MEQLGPIIFLAFIIIGLIAYSKYQEKSATESEQRERDAQKRVARERRESWNPPPYRESNTSKVQKMVPDDSADALLPSLQGAPKDKRSQLREVFVCYSIWDKQIIGKPHPVQGEAHEYGFEWIEENLEQTTERLLEFVTSGASDRLSAMWGTRHHQFALAVTTLIDLGDVDEYVASHAFALLLGQFQLCTVDLSTFGEEQWNTFFDTPDELPNLESYLTPIASNFDDISSIREYVYMAEEDDELYKL